MTETGIAGRLAATAAAYDQVSGLYAEFARGQLDARPLDRAVLAAFAEHVTAESSSTESSTTGGGRLVADLGCGPGEIGAHLTGLGLDVLGIDVSPAMIGIARAWYPGLRWATASMHALPLGDGALAGAVAWYSVIHAAPAGLPGYLAEIARAVRPGGYLLAAFFAADGEAVTEFDHKVAPAYRWPLGALAALAAGAGFAEVGRVSREPQPDERFRQGRLLLRRR